MISDPGLYSQKNDRHSNKHASLLHQVKITIVKSFNVPDSEKNKKFKRAHFCFVLAKNFNKILAKFQKKFNNFYLEFLPIFQQNFQQNYKYNLSKIFNNFKSEF